MSKSSSPPQSPSRMGYTQGMLGSPQSGMGQVNKGGTPGGACAAHHHGDDSESLLLMLGVAQADGRPLP